LFEGGVRAENKDAWFGFFKFGVAAGLYLLWQERMGELGIPPEEHFRDWDFVQREDDWLAELELPTVVLDCELRRYALTGYELISTGRLGGENRTSFSCQGELAVIFAMIKAGKLGERSVKVPAPRHVDALRKLGFTEMLWPNGKRYRLSSWGGLSGIRRVE
jgi:hypothetical protein